MKFEKKPNLRKFIPTKFLVLIDSQKHFKAGPSEAGGGGAREANNLLRFADFVSEKDCTSKGR